MATETTSQRATDVTLLAACSLAGVSVVSAGFGAGYWWYRGHRRGEIA